jgi:uncharacterized membrane protein YphA (DoxX/SURF4 family)
VDSAAIAQPELNEPLGLLGLLGLLGGFWSSFGWSSFFGDDFTTTAGTVGTVTSFAAAGLLAMATILATMEQTTVAATLTLLTTVATTVAMAVLAKASTGITANEGKGNQSDKGRKRNSEKTLHFFLRRRDSETHSAFHRPSPTLA